MLVLSFRGDYLAHKMEILGADSSNKLKSYVYGATVKVMVARGNADGQERSKAAQSGRCQATPRCNGSVDEPGTAM